jgi:hypothetical protein
MAFLFLAFPFVAFVAMLVVGVIMFVLKYGPKYLNLRNYTFNRDDEEQQWSGKAYSQPVSNA